MLGQPGLCSESGLKKKKNEQWNKEAIESEHGLINSSLNDSASLTTKENRCCCREGSEAKRLQGSTTMRT